MTVGLRIDPTVPVHRQPTFRVAVGNPGVPITRSPHTHQWCMYDNGVDCRCGALLVRLDGRRRYRGRHRR